MELQDVLNERRSIRSYDADKKVTKEQLEITLVVRDSVKKHIVETGSDKKYGARPLRRAVQSQLEDKLAEALLNGEIKRGDHDQQYRGCHGKQQTCRADPTECFSSGGDAQIERDSSGWKRSGG